MSNQVEQNLTNLYRKWVDRDTVDLGKLSAVIRREVLSAERGNQPWVSRDLLREMRAERAIVGRMIRASWAQS